MTNSCTNTYEVIVVGGGHAGVEAALAAARMGAKTLLLTHNLDTLGQMSCNPAIGGIGKSHLVREIDAMGGVMARAADQSGIHFRVLNSTKGAAVRATRCQSDRELYKRAIRNAVEAQDNLYLFQQTVLDLIVDNADKVASKNKSTAQHDSRRVRGVVTGNGLEFIADTVILATGTFLGGIIHIGGSKHQGGRAGESSSNALAQRLRALPFKVGRLKTGTPPRIDSRSINFSAMEEQPGDNPRPVMSFAADGSAHPQQVSCFITHTNKKTHALVNANKHLSPIYSGAISSSGPRYCPSIEDKIHRFADKSQHQIFVEPEGLNSKEVYPNGISTSLPYEIQQQFVRTIVGFENAHITRPGYAIEYDYFDPRDIHKSLQTKYIRGLFFAGQINGTTGYEEAAAQGLIAGINAVQLVRDEEPWLPCRSESYIGVMLDDLISKGVSEPYRLFTSRAEYRLLLREDNADERLSAIARNLGLLEDATWRAFQDKQERISGYKTLLAKEIINPEVPGDQDKLTRINSLLKTELKQATTLDNLLKRPEITLDKLQQANLCPSIDMHCGLRVETDIKYSGYIDRQQLEISKMERNRDSIIPEDFDYTQVPGLSQEAQSFLERHRPHNLQAAGLLEGVTPASISILALYVYKHIQKHSPDSTPSSIPKSIEGISQKNRQHSNSA